MHRSKTVLLSVSLLLIELIAGIQIYVLSLVTPEIGAELKAQQYFGLITTTSLAASFVTIPLAPLALGRWKASSLLLAGTWVTVIGGVTSALAPNIWVFATGRIFSGLAAGLLGAVSLAAIVRHLEARWRQMVLAGYSAMWVISSLVGPLYAALISELLSWRWALVLYLPLLLLARTLVAVSLREHSQVVEHRGESAGRTLLLSLALFTSVLTISLSNGSQHSIWLALPCGVAGALFFARLLLPAGVFSARRGRPSAVLLKFLLTGIYLGADSIIAVAISERFDDSVSLISATLMSSGLAWAVVGMFTGAKPATGRYFIWRGSLGIACLSAGLIGIGYLLVVLPTGAALMLTCCSGMTGLGIGLIYLDVMNALFEKPPRADGLKDAELATASVLSESIASTVCAAVLASVVSKLVISGAEAEIGWLFIALGAVAPLLLVPLRRTVDLR